MRVDAFHTSPAALSSAYTDWALGRATRSFSIPITKQNRFACSPRNWSARLLANKWTSFARSRFPPTALNGTPRIIAKKEPKASTDLANGVRVTWRRGLGDKLASDLRAATVKGDIGIDTISTPIDHFFGAPNTWSSIEGIETPNDGGSSLTIDTSTIDSLSPCGYFLLRHTEDDTIQYANSWAIQPPVFVDSQTRHVLESGETVVVVENTRLWQNPLEPLDANLDGTTSSCVLLGTDRNQSGVSSVAAAFSTPYRYRTGLGYNTVPHLITF